MVSVTTYQAFEHKGQRWTRHPAVAEEAYVMGVDLGQSQDPTAIGVLHHTKTPLDTWTVHEKALKTVQDVQQRFDCVVAERVPLNTSYPDIVAYVGEMLRRPALRDRCHLVIDESGVGRAVGDMFEAAGMRAVRVSITAGTDATKLDGVRRWSVVRTRACSHKPTAKMLTCAARCPVLGVKRTSLIRAPMSANDP
jgi:hypothetical protein